MKIHYKIVETNYASVIKGLMEIDEEIAEKFLDNTDTSYNYVAEQMGLDLMGTYKINVDLKKEEYEKIKVYCEEVLSKRFTIDEEDEYYRDTLHSEYEKRRDVFLEIMEIINSKEL